MRILLNLLPPVEKLALARRFRSRFFAWQSVLLLCLLLYYVSILCGVFFILRHEAILARDAEEKYSELNDETKKLALYQEEFKRANANANEVALYTKNHLHWSTLFTLLDEVTQEGVVIIELLTKDYTVSLSGQARTREDFLSFENRLKQTDCVSDVKVPISNLFSQTEVEFQIDFNIKRTCLVREKIP